MTLQIAFPIFDQVTALDAVGPYEVLQRFPDSETIFVADRLGEHRTDNGFLGLTADAVFADVPNPDVVVVPGGVGTRPLVGDSPIVTWLRAVHPTTVFTTSVCTGSLLLASAGLLDGLTATTHWGAFDALEKLGAEPVSERVVEHLDRRIITAAGVSSGIDMALRLASILADDLTAKALQLMIEYDPQPPFDAGSLATAGEGVLERLEQILAGGLR